MLALLASLALASSFPQALGHPDLVVHAPRLDQLDGIKAFSEVAGQRSVMFQLNTYSTNFHPLLDVDPFRAESLKAAGIDGTGPSTVSLRGALQLTCNTLLQDTKIFDARCHERLESMGDVAPRKLNGVGVTVARRDGKILGAVARRAQVACAMAGSLSEALLTELVRAVSAPGRAKTDGLAGALFVQSDDGLAGLQGTAKSLTLDARTRRVRTVLTAAARSPYPAEGPPGVLWTRLHTDPGALAKTIQSSLLDACSRCTGEAYKAYFQELESQLTGHAAVSVTSVKAQGSLNEPAARLQAMHLAAMAELKDGPKGSASLKAFAQAADLTTEPLGVRVPLNQGVAWLAVLGNRLVVANDEGARTGIQVAVQAKPGPLAHPLEVTVDPQRAAAALRQISLLDVMGSRELAGLFAFGTEFGPLLADSQRLSLWAEPGEPLGRAHAVWTLK